jgi:hypothetical protein
MEITELESKFLENAVTNDFNDFGNSPETIGNKIWIDCWDSGDHGAFCSKQQVSGVFSSLVKKGLIETDGTTVVDGREEGAFWITQTGWDAIRWWPPREGTR